MAIAIHPELETKLRASAAAKGLTVEAYLERVLSVDQPAENELEALALEGINSGAPFEVTSAHWEEKHRRLDERLTKTG